MGKVNLHQFHMPNYRKSPIPGIKHFFIKYMEECASLFRLTILLFISGLLFSGCATVQNDRPSAVGSVTRGFSILPKMVWISDKDKIYIQEFFRGNESRQVRKVGDVPKGSFSRIAKLIAGADLNMVKTLNPAQIDGEDLADQDYMFLYVRKVSGRQEEYEFVGKQIPLVDQLLNEIGSAIMNAKNIRVVAEGNSTEFWNPFKK